VIAAFAAGIVAGYALAIPVGAIAAYLVALTARTSLRVGAAAALGVATVDGAYALVAVVGGSAVARAIEPAAPALRWVAFAALLALAAKALWDGLHVHDAARARAVTDTRPLHAYFHLLALTAVNPATVIYFVALVIGLPHVDGAAASGAFVVAVLLASASWQLLLACGGALLGRWLTGARGRRGTGMVSGVIIAGLAVRTALG
jgi:threonine/homoserine/homoserine lactone efflux protein